MGFLAEPSHDRSGRGMCHALHAFAIRRRQCSGVSRASYFRIPADLWSRKLRKVDFLGAGFILASTTLFIVNNFTLTQPPKELTFGLRFL